MAEQPKPDFTIKPGAAVWLHGRAFRRGMEAQLVKTGFLAAQKKQQAERGMITLEEPDVKSGKTAKKAE